MSTGGRQAAAIFIVLLVLGFGARHMWQRYQQRQQAAASERLFAPLVEKFSRATVSGTERGSGWESAVATSLDFVELARDARSWDDFLAAGAERSLDGLRPSVASPILQLLRAMQALHAQENPEHRGATWALAQELTGSLGALLHASVEPGRITVTVDDQARRKIEGVLAALRHAHVAASPEHRAEIVAALMELLAAIPAVVEPWDRGALALDEALIALFEDDWARADRAARDALAVDTEDDTAALVAALASVESATPDTLEAVAARVDRLLAAVEQRNPGRTYPAALVRALLARRTNHPRAHDQFESLVAEWRGDEAPPNRAEQFRATVLRPTTVTTAAAARATWVWSGAATFSPTLQRARFPTDADPVGALRRALLGHVHDRVANGAQALLPADLAFCRRIFGAAFVEAFPQEAFLELVLRPVPESPRVAVAIRNDSGRGALQGSLVLLTRASGGDGESDAIPRPLARRPALEPLGETSFGEVELVAPVDTIDGAILVTEDVVAIVRTEEARATELAADRGRPTRDPSLRDSFGLANGSIATSLKELGRLHVEPATGAVRITLPDTLTPLRPIFRLRQGGEDRAPVERTQADGGWSLAFDGMRPARGARAVPALRIESPLAALLLTWKADEDGWVVDTVTEVD